MPAPLWPLLGAVAIWVVAIATCAAQLGGKLSWERGNWAMLLPFLAPPLLLVAHWMAGEVGRAWLVMTGSYAILFALGAVALGAAASTEDGGAVLAFMVIAACVLELPLAGWSAYHIYTVIHDARNQT